MILKVMTFNIQHCLDYINRVIDFDLFGQAINEISPDICGLNEVRGRGQREDYTAQAEKLAALTNMHSVFGLAAMIRGTEPYGNALLSKTPIIKTDITNIPVPEDVPKAEPRSVLRCELANGLVVYQTHFGLSEKELELAADTAYELFVKETRPAVLMGDFNLRPDHPAIAKLQNHPDIISTDPLLEGKFSFPSDNPDRKIDYIFAKNCKVFEADILPIIKSDHRPIIAKIEF